MYTRLLALFSGNDKTLSQLKERIAAFISSIAGPTTTVSSLNEIKDSADITQFIEQSTPIWTYFGLVCGSLLSFVMLIYWIRKSFKKIEK